MTASKAFGTSKTDFAFSHYRREYTALATALLLSAATMLSSCLTASHLSDAMPNASRGICISVLPTIRITLDTCCTLAPLRLQHFSLQLEIIICRLYRYSIRLENFYKQ
jgi:hypothetical protein